MELVRIAEKPASDADDLIVSTNRDEIAALANAAREAIEAVEEWEFHTRTGFTKQEMRALQERLHGILRQERLPE